jgi:hypothetical protein
MAELTLPSPASSPPSSPTLPEGVIVGESGLGAAGPTATASVVAAATAIHGPGADGGEQSLRERATAFQRLVRELWATVPAMELVVVDQFEVLPGLISMDSLMRNRRKAQIAQQSYVGVFAKFFVCAAATQDSVFAYQIVGPAATLADGGGRYSGAGAYTQAMMADFLPVLAQRMLNSRRFARSRFVLLLDHHPMAAADVADRLKRALGRDRAAMLHAVVNFPSHTNEMLNPFDCRRNNLKTKVTNEFKGKCVEFGRVADMIERLLNVHLNVTAPLNKVAIALVFRDCGLDKPHSLVLQQV